MFRSKKSILLFACLALVSCNKANEDAKKGLTPPADEATAEERSEIDATLADIEGITGNLGHARSFRKLPVILTTDDRTFTDHPAACVSSGGVPQFILLKRSVLEDEAELRDAGVETSLFRVLLHEIGHCYFARQHEEARLYEDGKAIELASPDGQSVEYPMLDASVMVPEELTIPVALKRYYVAEILGVYRAGSLDELAAYVSAKVVRNEL